MTPVNKLGNSRVCDRCIRKKVKCNLQRPQCSRCSEGGYPCVYSAERRKPGPARGSRRQQSAAVKSSEATQNGSVDTRHHPTGHNSRRAEILSPASPQLPFENDGSTPTDSGSQNYSGEMSFDVSSYMPMPGLQGSPSLFLGYTIGPHQERVILTEFFQEIHHAIPLLEKGRFMRLYGNGEIRRSLVVAIAAITAKLLGPVHDWNPRDLDLCINTLLTMTQNGESVNHGQVDLENFQQECLLAYYDFHQSPGPQAWMRIAKLSRKAYAVGLHQIENPELCSAFDSGMVTDGTVENWRYIWWCIYCLDSYSNISSGAPFVIAEESMNTALPSRPFDEDIDTPWVASSPKLFLPDDASELWNVAQEIVSHGKLVGFRLHMVVTTMIRQAGDVLRMRAEKGRERSPARVAHLKRDLASLRLALPPRYLNPARHMLSTETSADHHVRLTNIFILHMTRLMLSLPGEMSDGEEEWMKNWQQALEASEDIVHVVEQWDSRFSAHADPAICFIVFIALVVLDLHRKSGADEAPGSGATVLTQSERILLLFLEQFGSLWTLPKFLARVFKDSQTMQPETLTPARIAHILKRLKPPLHPKFGRSYQDFVDDPVSQPFVDPSSMFSTGLWWNSDAAMNFDMPS